MPCPSERRRISSTAGARSIDPAKNRALSWGEAEGTGAASSAAYPRAPAGRARGPAEQRRRWAVAARAIGRQRQVCQVTSEHQSNRMDRQRQVWCNFQKSRASTVSVRFAWKSGRSRVSSLLIRSFPYRNFQGCVSLDKSTKIFDLKRGCSTGTWRERRADNFTYAPAKR